ncbi:flagellar basal body L-ring protein FlgH [Desulfotalea psychrophila]|uniref:Flagellar L-ring protein n=1 Tax=Desulfotalea psychrophila (strain LSv54 / DSM 12343) TaxID=177439 RepID=FLGH_DESPS|nr:flagellar basal body L-ring protein FlgH [Desulfotalea psychrophila]Q6AJR8.1 RecName: Full=Flagellar L-ring protein; AltName: Full=Basal body L-ring protein; Flags: Precursor [Desulfotalea psychrophila LSv54]CAG37412.1 related to flagellar L-ring protein precursor (FlgH) [Desulfotalea psychrophila LSv54]
MTYRRIPLYLSCLFLLALSGCNSKRPPLVEIPEPLEELQTMSPATRQAGSLWDSNQNSLFSDRKASNVGDIVTVLIEEKSSASKNASTKTGKDSSIGASIPNLFGLEKSSIIANNHIDMNNLIGASFKNDFKGAGSTSRSGTLSAALSTQVIVKYPNGQLKIRGGKEVMVNNEVQVIYLTGIIRPVDITAANTINSDKILNARISYTGKGALGDKQEPGWLTRSLDHVWPF